jgi:hypothetical protein
VRVAKAEEILREVRGLVPDLAKADDTATDGEGSGEGDGGEGGDEDAAIATATEAIACIAKLIISEAESLAEGNLHEAMDISLLLDAVRSLKWFNEREQCEKDAHAMDRADQATTAKADAPASAAGEGGEAAPVAPTPADAAQTEQGAAESLTKADVAELVKSAIAEVSTAQEERIESLTGELAKAMKTIGELQAMPLPGGPALTRTAAQAQSARDSDAILLRSEADELLAKADACSDRELREGYLERRRELLAKADA